MKWAKIDGYKNYSISDSGYVRNDKTKRILAFNINGNGYRRVCLSKEGESKYPFIHRLVYETFVGEVKKGFVIDHIDNNKSNNRLDNLRVTTFSNNLTKEYGRRPNKYKRFTKEEKIDIDKAFEKGYSAKQVSNEFNISYTYACKIKNEGWTQYNDNR